MKNRIRNFEIQTKLGSGSYGVIYKAMNKSTRETCVLKQISLGRLSEKARKSAINEATIMGKLTHPFIVRYQQSFIEDNTLNIVMEYCDNGDLANFLKMQNKKPMKEEKIWRFFIEICVGLEYIHKNKILHRDIKTLNIFMNKNEEIKIGDLGVAKMLTSNEFAQTMVGTPFYLSPELCEEKPYNEKSDIWAMGCLLYELCTFRHPFEAQNQASLILKIIRGKYLPIPEFYSQDLREVIDLCLERDYKRRPTTSNLLAKHKIQSLTQQFGIDKLVEDYMKKVSKQKQTLVNPKPLEDIPKPPVKIVKAIDEPKKEIKKEEPAPVKKEEIKKEEVKREVPLPKPIVTQSQKKIEQNNVNIMQMRRPTEQNISKKESKNEFVSNLEKMIEDSDKHKKPNKSEPSYAQISAKNYQIIERVAKKDDKIQRIAEKVEQLKRDQKHIESVKSPPISEQKRYTPNMPEKKPLNSVDISKKQESACVSQGKILNQAKIAMMPPKPPSSVLQNKEAVLKVKNEKIVQPKVYESQKNVIKPQGIIKSGGFSAIVEPDRQKPSLSQDRLSAEKSTVSAKRPSVHQVFKPEKGQKEEPKQLFGPSPTAQHKSERNFKNVPSQPLEQKKEVKKEDINKISRIRKGGKNELARNARNVSRYNEVTKQEEDLVMNLPTKLKNQQSSSDSEEQRSHRGRQVKQDTKGKTKNKFQLKEINHDLVLQKYEDMMKSEFTHPNQAEDSDSEEAKQMNQQFDKEIKDEIDRELVPEEVEEYPYDEEQEYGRKNSSQPIEEALQSADGDQNLQKQQDLDKQFDENYAQNYERESQWSFDQQPELPMLSQKESPYFQENNPYLIEQQQESLENKINHLQTKLSENMKREDEINKLMQIKLEECRKFIPVEKILQQILDFFRKKLNTDEELEDADEKEIENFLKKKGLTDQRKFQNIYKIMHFELELENTRKIIQRICKKLNDFETQA